MSRSQDYGYRVHYEHVATTHLLAISDVSIESPDVVVVKIGHRR